MKNYIIFNLDDSKDFRGGSRQVLYLSKGLNEKNIENYIVTRKNSPLYNKAIENNIKIITVPYIFEWDIISALILAYKIKKINKNHKHIILHSHTAHTAAISYLTSLFIKAKRIVHRRSIFKLNKNIFTKIKYKTANKIIAISNTIKNALINWGIEDKKISVIYSTIESKETVLIKNFNKETITIGTLIAFTEEKDPQNLIYAADICLKENKNLIFLIGGEGYLKSDIQKLIENLNLKDKIILKGYINNNIDFLKSIDIFVLPSKEEGLGSVLIEAMSVGLPLIGTNAGGIPEIIEDGYNGFVVDKQNPKELAKAILNLIKDKKLCEIFSKNSFERAKNFTSDTMVEKTIDVYEQTI